MPSLSPGRPQRVLGYARVSSHEQTFGQSLQEQQASATAYAKARGLTVARFFVEAESGGREKIEHREQMRLLLQEARKGDLVLVDKLDRWSRDPEFTYRSVREILERGAHMFFVAEDIDPSTHDGDTKLNFRVLFAREEHKRIRERTTGTRRSLRARGYFVEGHVPFGYRRAKPQTHRDVERHVLVVEPKEAAVVKDVFQRAARGERLAYIAAELGWVHQRVLRMVKNRHYLGEIRVEKKGEWSKGLHPAIVSASLFERAYKTVTSRVLGPRRSEETSLTRDWILKNVARCAFCEGAMTAAYGRDRNLRHLGATATYVYFYYRCFRRCETRNYVRVQSIEAAVAEMVEQKLCDWKEELATGPEPVRKSSVDFAAKRIALERKRTKHIEAHGDGTISIADLRTQLAKLDVERQKIEAAESAAGVTKRTNDPKVRREMLRDVKAIEVRWRNADPKTKREILNQLAKAVRISKHGADPVWRTVDELAEDLGR